MNKRIIDIINEFEEIIKIIPSGLQIKENGCYISIYSRYQTLRELAERAVKSENTEMLILPLLYQFVKDLLDIFPVTLNDVISGKAKEICDKFTKITDDIEYEGMEEYMIDLFNKISYIMDTCEFTYSKDLRNEYEKIAVIALNAIGLIDTIKKSSNMIAIGEDDKSNPKIYSQIVKVSSYYEFAQLTRTRTENCILLGCLTQTVGDIIDPLYEEIHGYPEELLRNTMRNDDLTREEAEKEIHEWSSSILIGIKRGENVFVTSIRNSSATVYNSFFEYGKRVTYLPYQVFWDTVKDNTSSFEENVNSTELAVKNVGWYLKDILDEEQAIFFSVLFSEIQKEFFKGDLPTDKKLAVFGEDVELIEDKKKTTALRTRNNTMEIPVVTVTKKYTDEEENLLNILKMDKSECLSNNLVPRGIINPDKMDSFIEKRADELLASKVRRRIEEYISDQKKIKEAKEWFFEHLHWENHLLDIPDSVEVHRHRQDVNYLSGKRAYGSLGIKTGELTVKVTETRRKRTKYYFTKTAREIKVPHIVLMVHPRTAEEIAILTETNLNDLPELLQIFGFLTGEKAFLNHKVEPDYKPKMTVIGICNFDIETNEKDLNEILGQKEK